MAPLTTSADKEPKPRTKNRAAHHAELLVGLANQGDGDAYTIDEFCRRHRISVQVFYKYRSLMPRTFRVGTRVLISREAAAAWRREREAASNPAT